MNLGILIVNDHKMYREALRDIGANYPDIEVAVVAESGEGLEGLEWVGGLTHEKSRIEFPIA